MRHWITSFQDVDYRGWGRRGDPASLDSVPARRHLRVMQIDDTISTVQAPWRDIALVCGKCSRKLGGGFGKKGRHDLADVLKGVLKESGRRRELRVVEVGCLGLCPKRAVTAVSSARPNEVLTIPQGTDPTQILARFSVPAAAAPSPVRPG